MREQKRHRTKKMKFQKTGEKGSNRSNYKEDQVLNRDSMSN